MANLTILTEVFTENSRYYVQKYVDVNHRMRSTIVIDALIFLKRPKLSEMASLIIEWSDKIFEWLSTYKQHLRDTKYLYLIQNRCFDHRTIVHGL